MAEKSSDEEGELFASLPPPSPPAIFSPKTPPPEDIPIQRPRPTTPVKSKPPPIDPPERIRGRNLPMVSAKDCRRRLQYTEPPRKDSKRRYSFSNNNSAFKRLDEGRQSPSAKRSRDHVTEQDRVPPSFVHKPRQTFTPRPKKNFYGRHDKTFAVMCIRSDGYTITNGSVYYSFDGPIRQQVLLEKIFEMRVAYLVLTDSITKRKWTGILENLPEFHPAWEIKAVPLDKPAKSIGRCVHCSKDECHRWIAVIGGIAPYLNIKIGPISH